MKCFATTIALLVLCTSLSAQSKRKPEKLPLHQLVPFYTNAITGSTRSERQFYNKEPRYGMNVGLDYNVKLKKWFSIGTGLGFILHRAYTSDTYDSSSFCGHGIICPNFSEGIKTKGALDLPLKAVFTVLKKKNVELLLETGLSIQSIIYEKSNYTKYYDSENKAYDFTYTGFDLRYGFVVGPILKIGAGTGLLIGPEFRLIHPERKGKSHPAWRTEKHYSAGLKLGWFFNLS